MKTTSNLSYLLLEVLTEIKLDPANAVEIEGNRFKVGRFSYFFKVQNINLMGKSILDIGFDQEDNPDPNLPTSNTDKGDAIKVYSTMYKVILDTVKQQNPKLFSISALQKTRLHGIYLKLTKTNTIPGYMKINPNLEHKANNQELVAILFKKL